GLTSAVTPVTFTFILAAQGTVATDVTPSATPGQYDYRFTVSGPAASGWQLDTFSVPVPAGASAGGLVTPAGWTAVTAAGQVSWSANDTAAGLTAGESGGFGFTGGAP